MSVRLTVSTRNTRATIANVFSRADARTQKEARTITKRFGERTQKRARALAPVSALPRTSGGHEHLPGFLRDHIVLRFSDDGLVYEVGWREAEFKEAGEPFYALYTEFGTRFMTARPCVFPARDEVFPEYEQALRSALRRAYARRSA